jgi:hypothetical protein
MTPLTAVLLAERARLGGRALPSLAAASARLGEYHKDAGPPRRGATTSEDEDEQHREDVHGALPSSPGGQPAPLSKEALREYDVEKAQTEPPLEDAASTARTETGVRGRVAGQRRRRCARAVARDAMRAVACAVRRAARWLTSRCLAWQVHVHAGSPLPGGVEGVEVTSALPGRPRGAGAPFEQRRGL